MSEKISLIIPCKNEVESLGAVLNEVKDNNFITETLVTHKNSNMCKIVIREDTIKT